MHKLRPGSRSEKHACSPLHWRDIAYKPRNQYWLWVDGPSKQYLCLISIRAHTWLWIQCPNNEWCHQPQFTSDLSFVSLECVATLTDGATTHDPKNSLLQKLIKKLSLHCQKGLLFQPFLAPLKEPVARNSYIVHGWTGRIIRGKKRKKENGHMPRSEDQGWLLLGCYVRCWTLGATFSSRTAPQDLITKIRICSTWVI